MHYILTLVLFCISMIAVSQSMNYSNWLDKIDDERTIASLSVPGAHNAATGEGVCFFSGIGVTQFYSIEDLWEHGIRAFDLRPAVNESQLHIYHGLLKTHISFNEVLDIICNKLEQNPREFAIILLREERESENDTEQAMWQNLIGKAIDSLGEKATIFTPGITVGDIRGKILFLSRNYYNGTDKGALITGWSHSSKGTYNACITSCCNGEKAVLRIQDFYSTVTNDKLIAKKNVVTEFICGNNIIPETYTINFLSAYSSTWLGFTPFATTSGYRRNAVKIHEHVIDLLSKESNNANKSLGIVFMDFAGVDYISGTIWHWKRFKIQGEKLLKLIIEHNFSASSY